MQFIKMSIFLASLLFVLVMTGAEAKEKQIKLEDIERDNLAAERHVKSTKQQQPLNHNNQGYPQLAQQLSYQPLGHPHQGGNYYLPNVVKTQSYQSHPIQTVRQQLQQYQQQQYTQHHQHQQHQPSGVQGTPTPPRMQYGFVPIKSPNYPSQQYQTQPQQQQQEPQVQYQYVTPNHGNAHSHTHTQAYLPTVSPVSGSGRHPSSGTVPAGLQPPRIQYAVQQPEEAPQSHQQPSKFTIPIQTQAYQQYVQSQSVNAAHAGHASQGQSHTQIQYIPESQLQYYQYQTQNEQQSQGHQHQQQHPQQQIQYVVDNSIQNDPQAVPQEEQKYYQQFVYIQPYQTPSASSNIHSIADTKGNVQYVMYIPAGVAAAATYPAETVLAYPTNQETQYVYQPVLEEPEVPRISSVSKSSSPGVTGATLAHSPDGASINTPRYESSKSPKRFERPVFKHQPTSLLDSYVPSYLQYQYYKQQQSEPANAIKHNLKLSSSDVGKTDVVKSYKGESREY